MGWPVQENKHDLVEAHVMQFCDKTINTVGCSQVGYLHGMLRHKTWDNQANCPSKRDNGFEVICQKQGQVLHHRFQTPRNREQLGTEITKVVPNYSCWLLHTFVWQNDKLEYTKLEMI